MRRYVGLNPLDFLYLVGRNVETLRLISMHAVFVYSALHLSVYSSLSSNIYELPLAHELGQFHQSCCTENGGGGGEGGLDVLMLIRWL